MTLRPELTVAAAVERDGRFLMVEERVSNRMVFNQPAGHVERGEQFIEAVVRETLEETAWNFRPEALIGIYLWEHPEKERTFLRATFCGCVDSHDPTRRLDRGIERALWMSRDELIARSWRLRSPMVLKCIDDYVDGVRYPLDVVKQVLKNPAVAASPERRAQSFDQSVISLL